MDMICDHLGLPKTRRWQLRIGTTLRFVFAHKLVLPDGRNFWATDKRYCHSRSCSRHDMLWLKGLENQNALCGEAVCFVYVENVQALGLIGFQNVLHLVLVRWLQPHDNAWERDERGFPVCPGPFHVNNCLWRYSRTPTPRASLRNDPVTDNRALEAQYHMFGSTDVERNQRVVQEKFAYYGLVEGSSIVDTLNMCNTFIPNTSDPVYDTWLQTVCMI